MDDDDAGPTQMNTECTDSVVSALVKAMTQAVHKYPVRYATVAELLTKADADVATARAQVTALEGQRTLWKDKLDEQAVAYENELNGLYTKQEAHDDEIARLSDRLCPTPAVIHALSQLTHHLVLQVR